MVHIIWYISIYTAINNKHYITVGDFWTTDHH